MDTLAQIANSIYEEITKQLPKLKRQPRLAIDKYGQLYIIKLDRLNNKHAIVLRIWGHTPHLNYDIETETADCNLLLAKGQLTDPNSTDQIITTINEYLPISYEENP
jgi:hypothetical protein